MLCPICKTVVKTRHGNQTDFREETNEYFNDCVLSSCMAYKNGECKMMLNKE